MVKVRAMRAIFLIPMITMILFVSGCGDFSASGGVSYQPPFAPIIFTLNSNGIITIQGNASIVTPLGTFAIDANVSDTLQPEDNALLVIIRYNQKGTVVDTAYKIATQQEVIVVLDAKTTLQITNKRILIDASKGTVKTIEVKGVTPDNTPVLQTSGNSQGETGITPTPTQAAVVPGQVLCCTSNFSGWGGSSDWHVLNGSLLNDGSYHQIQPSSPTIVAPTVITVANYAVEARIMMQSCEYAEQSSFGITVRGSDASGSWQGYKVALHGLYGIQTLSVSDAQSTDLDTSIQSVAFSPGNAVRAYRIEVKDNTLKVFIEGNMLLSVVNNEYLSPGQVGLWSAYCQLTVSSFQITAL